MSYATSVLQPGEKIVAVGRLHWIIYNWAIASIVVGTILVVLEYSYMPHDGLIAVTAVSFAVLFVITFLWAWFIRWITEFAVTNRRVIYKRGFITRRTAEMNMDKVESVDVDQTVPGRVLGYGTVRVLGTGSSAGISVNQLAAPFVLRNAIIAK